jgi:hypothetical protein
VIRLWARISENWGFDCQWLEYQRIGGLIVNGVENLLFVTTSRLAVETKMGAKDQDWKLTTYF